MNGIMRILLLAYLVVSLSLVQAQASDNTIHSGREYVDDLITTIEQQYLKLFDDDVAAAKQAIDYFTGLKAVRLVALALDHNSLSVRSHAAASIVGIADRSVLPKIVASLETHISAMRGGAEIQIPLRRLRGNLIAAIEKITKQDLGPVDVSSELEVEKIVARSKKWIAENPSD